MVLTHNGWNDVAACLESLDASEYRDFDVILVDNGSESCAPSDVSRSRSFPLKVARNPINLGIAGGNNTGLRIGVQRGSRYLMTLSDDTIVDSLALGLLVTYLDEHPTIGAMSAGLYYYSDQTALWFGGAGYISWLARAPHLRRRVPKVEEAHVVPTRALLGCNMIVRHQVLEDVGPFDDRYFFQSEDLDFSLRLSRAGWAMVVDERARIFHKISQTVPVESADRWYYANRNRLLLIDSQLWGWRRWSATLAFYLSRPVLFIKWLSVGRGDLASASIQGIADFLRGRFGVRPSPTPSMTQTNAQ